MKANIWECEERHVHITHDGVEMLFEHIDAFIEALLIWQEYAIQQKLSCGNPPDHFWDNYSTECKN